MSKNFRRTDLDALVWSKPVSQLAIELQVTESLTRTICQKYEIPLPKSGYWSKVKFGKKVKIPTLSPKVAWDEVTIDFQNPLLDEKASHRLRLTTKIKEIESQFPLDSMTHKRLSNPDKLIIEVSNYFKSSEARSYYPNGLCHSRSGMLAIAVTRKNIPRAIRFMNSLIKLLRARNHLIRVDQIATTLIIDGETQQIKLMERCSRKVVKVDPWKQTELIPTGLLALKLVHPYSNEEWVDGKLSLEQQITKIVASLEIRSEDEKKERARREKFWAEQDRLKEIEKRLASEKAWEAKKVEILLSQAKKWKQASDLGLFISAIENKIIESADASASVQSWLEWAKVVKESIDPLADGMDSMLRQYIYGAEEISGGKCKSNAASTD